MNKPWLITVDEAGKLTEHEETEALPVVAALVASHARHDGIFYVKACAACRAAYGEQGERWPGQEASDA